MAKRETFISLGDTIVLSIISQTFTLPEKVIVFTLNDVRAADVPEDWDPKVYLNPTKLTIPQFNFRVGFSINDRWTISGGWDHMKYKILQEQIVDIDGFIDPLCIRGICRSL